MSPPITIPPGRATSLPPPRGVRPSATAKLPAWGWLEWFILAQTFIPALLFVPGISSIRIVTRIGVFGLALIAWVAIARSGRRPAPGTFSARPWLLFCAAYLGVSILHPTTNSLLAGAAQAAILIAVMSPVFWVDRVVTSSRQLSRVMAILFVCNATSAVVGVGQIYRPNLFNPPQLNAFASDIEVGSRSYTDTSGQMIIRPPGLTDSPGAACGPGEFAVIVGLCWALMPIAAWKRLASLGLACSGAAAIYFCQVRQMIVVTVICLVGLVIILGLQRNFRRAMLLGLGGTVVLGGALAWAVAKVGNVIGDRFATITSEDASSFYHGNRGRFLESTLNYDIYDYPLGAGLGRWGTIYGAFGDRSAPPNQGLLWVEIQITAWVYDGGIPLLVASLVAIGLALVDSLRIALTSKDREVAYWAGVVAAASLGIAATCFSYPTFASPIGLQFWLMAAVVNAADRRVLAEAAGGRARIAT